MFYVRFILIHSQFSISSQKSLNSTSQKSTENADCVPADESCIDKPMKWPSGKRSNFDFHNETETAMNNQINMELKAFYYYLSMVDTA